MPLLSPTIFTVEDVRPFVRAAVYTPRMPGSIFRPFLFLTGGVSRPKPGTRYQIPSIVYLSSARNTFRTTPAIGRARERPFFVVVETQFFFFFVREIYVKILKLKTSESEKGSTSTSIVLIAHVLALDAASKSYLSARRST